MAACSVQEDKAMFPGCSDVVRVHTERWTPLHSEILDNIFEQVKQFLQSRTDLPFDDLLRAYQDNEPCANVGKHNAYILYGPSGAFYLDADDELKMDVKGLVFRPAVRRKGGRIVAVFG